MEANWLIKLCYSSLLIGTSFFFPNFIFGQIEKTGCDTVTDYGIIICKGPQFFNPLLKEFHFIDELRDTNSNNRFQEIQHSEQNHIYIFHLGDLIYSINGDFQDGIHVYETDLIKVTGMLKDGQLSGEVLLISKSNGTKTFKTYKRNLLHGIVRQVDSNGNLLYFCKYKEGRIHGLEVEFYDNGMPRFQQYFENGKPKDGKQYIFDGDGNAIGHIVVKGGEVISLDYY